MKKSRLLSLMLLLALLVSFGLSACGKEGDTPSDPTASGSETKAPVDPVDYAGSVNLDLNSTATKKAKVNVHLYIDGDTVHFNIKDSFFEEGIVKARFLAVNTPESTGKIEPYGKKASDFTKNKLLNATSIYIESDDQNWNADSTGGRYLLWIWYQTEEGGPYRNLNIELLQEGLSIASNSGQNRYGTTCLAALGQAKELKLNCHSKQKDPDFYYGAAQELTLKELRNNIASYENTKVAFEGIIFRDDSETIHVMAYDEEDGLYYGMQVYYGTNANSALLGMFAIGNKVRIVGTVTNFQGTYQVSGLSYNMMKPNDPANTQLVSTGHEVDYVLYSVSDFNNKTLKVMVTDTETGEETEVEKDLPSLIINTAVSFESLQVVSIYTTQSGKSAGAMTITCKVGNETIEIRTNVLRDENGELLTAADYQGKNINVKGMVEMYNGDYQIKVFSYKDITIN